MYDIIQLSDMLLPELLDIAEQLNIPNHKQLDKQSIIYKILDWQAVAAGEAANNNTTEESKVKKQ